MPTKNQTEERILCGVNGVWYKPASGSWTDFGLIKKGAIIGGDTFGTTDIERMGGGVGTQLTSRKVYCQFEMTQTSKAAKELADTLNGKSAEIWADDGVVGNKYSEFYGKKGMIFISIDDSIADGSVPQTIKVHIIFEEQSSNVSVADTGLPTVTHQAAATYTGNKYRVWAETAVS